MTSKICVLHNVPTKEQKLDFIPDGLFETNNPIKRQTLILDKLNKYKQIIPNLSLDLDKLKELKVHDSPYLDFLYNCYSSYEKTPDKDYMTNNQLIPYHFSKSLTKNIHKLPYWHQMGYYCSDVTTPITKLTYDIALSSCNNCYMAPQYLNNYDIIYCLNTFPGHHAHRARYGGYCYLNNLAVCSKVLSKKYTRQSILDIDYHAGDGTCDIFLNDKNIQTISIHADPTYDYPAYSSFEEDNTETNINIIFEKKSNIYKYISYLSKAIDKIQEHKPEVLLIALGIDTLNTDPDASKLYGCGLEPKDFAVISSLIKNNLPKIPIIISQEGGYDLDNISDSVEYFINGFNM
jgi:acetoin utilization deacetylase AcuC-like enzyme